MDYRKKKDLQGKYAKTRDNYNAEKWFDHEAREKSMELKKFYGVKTYQNPKMSFSILCNECALNIIPPILCKIPNKLSPKVRMLWNMALTQSEQIN